MELVQLNDVYIIKNHDLKDYETLKSWGFRYHLIDKCFIKDPTRCKGCKYNINFSWWTPDPKVATKASELAKEPLKTVLDGNEETKNNRLFMSAAHDMNIDPAPFMPTGFSLYPYQKVILAYNDQNILLADEMGLGKSIQAIIYINKLYKEKRIKNVLIVCPAYLKLNWNRELEKWLIAPLSFGIATPQSFPDTNIVVVNYRIFDRFDDQIKSRVWDLFVADEAHALKNPQSRRSAAVYGGTVGKKTAHKFERLKANQYIFMSGTPIENKPEEIFHIARFLFPKEEIFKNWYRFMNTYYNRDFKVIPKKRILPNGEEIWERKRITDYRTTKNLDDLQRHLRNAGMIRRLRRDVLKQLPPKTLQLIELDGSDLLPLLRQENEALARVVELKKRQAQIKAGKINGLLQSVAKELNEARSELFRLWQETSLQKIPDIVQMALDYQLAGEKVLIFCYHRAVARELYEKLKDCAILINGSVPTGKRDELIQKFRTDPKINFIVATMDALKEGVTINESNTSIYVQLHFKPSVIEQTGARNHRIGQENPVNHLFVVYPESYDAAMSDAIIRKKDNIDKTLNIENLIEFDAEIEIDVE